MTKINLSKRILLMFLVAWITFISVFGAYQHTTYCAEWVAGAIATVGCAPIMTALLIGGVVIAGGIAAYEIAQTDAEDYRNFYNGIKQGFQEFVSDQEKQIALEQNSSLTDQEAADIGVAVAREKVNGFFNEAIDTTKNTVKNIRYDTMAYWDLYSRIISSVADNGITADSGGIIAPTDRFIPRLINYNSGFEGVTSSPMESIGSNTEAMNGRSYIVKGVVNATNVQNANINNLNKTYLTIPILFAMPYIDRSNTYLWTVVMELMFERNTGNFLGYQKYGNSDNIAGGNYISTLNNYISNSSVNVVLARPDEGQSPMERCQQLCNVIGLAPEVLAIGESSVIPSWERTINSTLNDTHIGKSIQTGRHVLVNDGDWIGSIFQEDSVPVRKSSLTVQDGVVTGELGWDIPLPTTWDDYINGKRKFGDVVDDTGAIGVPDSSLDTPQAGDTTVDYPVDTPVQDTTDYPKDDTDVNDRPQEIPDKPQQDVFDENGGSFYPSAMDLTNIFPFCIPFDVIYLIEKFDASGERAPVITIPIVYPSSIQGVMGSSGYDVVIDFQDYVAVRNVIRVFLLLLFLAGLIKITRDLIRG